MLGQDRFRVKLDAKDCIIAVLQGHHFVLLAQRGDLQVVWHGGIDKQRVIACGGKRAGQVMQDALPAVTDL